MAKSHQLLWCLKYFYMKLNCIFLKNQQKYVEFYKFRNGKIKTGMELWDNETDEKER